MTDSSRRLVPFVLVLTLTGGGSGVAEALAGLSPLAFNQKISKTYKSRDHKNLPAQLEAEVRLVSQTSCFLWLGNSYLFTLGLKTPEKDSWTSSNRR